MTIATATTAVEAVIKALAPTYQGYTFSASPPDRPIESLPPSSAQRQFQVRWGRLLDLEELEDETRMPRLELLVVLRYHGRQGAEQSHRDMQIMAASDAALIVSELTRADVVGSWVGALENIVYTDDSGLEPIPQQDGEYTRTLTFTASVLR